MRAKFLIALSLTIGALVAAGPALANPRDAGLQVALKASGLYLGPIDGDVGPLTRAAVVAVQQKAHLPATGIVTTRTRKSLGPLGRPLLGKRPIWPGEMGLDVSALQFLLARADLYHGALDGFMGPKLETAVRVFQAQANLPVDGVAGPATLKALIKHARVAHAPIAHAPIAHAPVNAAYLVVSGDSLTAIAGRYGITLAALAGLNHLDPAKPLLIGTTLVVPSNAQVNSAISASTTSTSAVSATTASTNTTVSHASLGATPTDVPALLDKWSATLGVSPHLIHALAWMESGYQPDVVSDVGAQGVMQVMPTTWSFVEEVLVGHPIPHTTDGDIEVGVLYIRYLLGQFNGDPSLALAAWYQGAAALRAYGPYEMTKPFVTDVLALQTRM